LSTRLISPTQLLVDAFTRVILVLIGAALIYRPAWAVTRSCGTDWQCSWWDRDSQTDRGWKGTWESCEEQWTRAKWDTLTRSTADNRSVIHTSDKQALFTVSDDPGELKKPQVLPVSVRRL